MRSFTPVDRIRIAGVPALVAAEGPPERAAARGTVLFYHPLGADKEAHADDLRRLASRGLLAVGLDAIAHGERRVPHAAALYLADPMAALLEVVSSTAGEVPAIVDALVQRGWAAPGRIAVAGVSLGGFVAYGAAVLERRLAAAVAITASPAWGPSPRSPHASPERFFPIALLSVVARADRWVPPAAARALHRALAPRYAAAPERLRLVELDGEPHHLGPGGRLRARDEAERWLERFLPLAEAAGEDAAAP